MSRQGDDDGCIWRNGRLKSAGKQRVGDLCDVYVPFSSKKVNTEPWLYLGVLVEKDSWGRTKSTVMVFMPPAGPVVRVDFSRHYDHVHVISRAADVPSSGPSVRIME